MPSIEERIKRCKLETEWANAGLPCLYCGRYRTQHEGWKFCTREWLFPGGRRVRSAQCPDPGCEKCGRGWRYVEYELGSPKGAWQATHTRVNMVSR